MIACTIFNNIDVHDNRARLPFHVAEISAETGRVRVCSIIEPAMCGRLWDARLVILLRWRLELQASRQKPLQSTPFPLHSPSESEIKTMERRPVERRRRNGNRGPKRKREISANCHGGSSASFPASNSVRLRYRSRRWIYNGKGGLNERTD